VIARDRSSRAAARNNAEWCDTLCRTHGIEGRFDPDVWVAPRRTPRYNPDAVTLDPAAVAGSILERIDASPGCSIKDSFAALDMGPYGFQIVREAEWIYREPTSSRVSGPSGMRWIAVETADELLAWAAAWDVDGAPAGLFRPALLRDPSVMVLGGYVEGSIVAGAIANRSGRELAGLSNVFAKDEDLDRAWRGTLDYLDSALPGSAIVGYASGADLAVALRLGFQSVGLEASEPGEPGPIPHQAATRLHYTPTTRRGPRAAQGSRRRRCRARTERHRCVATRGTG